MKDSNENDNDLSTLILPVDFKTKAKVKPNTDRSYTLSSAGKKQANEFTSINPSVLIEKKKQYSMAIRQKNLSKKIRNELPVQEDMKKIAQTQTLKSNPSLLNQTFQNDCKIQQKHANSRTKNGKENDLHSKVKNAKREMTKIKKMSAAIEDIQSYTMGKKFSQRPIQFDSRQIFAHKIQPPHPSLKFTLTSTLNESFGPFQNLDEKQCEILRRQNTTFKKQLANFRKENGTLKREIEQFKKKLVSLQQNNDFLASQNEDNIRLLQSFQLKVGESFESICLKEQVEDKEGSDKLREMLVSYQQQLWQADNRIRKLELRSYMLEKRLADEGQAHRKAMAREISAWKQRYIKARNQNLRLKDCRGSALFEMSLSIEG